MYDTSSKGILVEIRKFGGKCNSSNARPAAQAPNSIHLGIKKPTDSQESDETVHILTGSALAVPQILQYIRIANQLYILVYQVPSVWTTRGLPHTR
jgi:hypothetical protein